MNGGAVDGRGVRVVSAVPGRMRLQTGPSGRPALIALAEELGTWSSIAAVDLRMGSASIVLRFDAVDAEAVAHELSELGVELRAGSPPALRSPAAAIEATATAGNRAVAQRLQGTDVRTLVPLGLGLLAVRRAMRGGERLADAPWYVLAW